MTLVTKGYVGKKGEIYIEKKVREMIGLRPGDNLIVYAYSDNIVIKKIPSLDDILAKKSLATISVDEIERISEEEQRRYER